MAETKVDLEKRVADLEAELAAQTEKVVALQAEAQEKAADPVLDAAAKEALRKAVDDFREVEATPAGADRSGLLAVAGKTLADRVEGVIG